MSTETKRTRITAATLDFSSRTAASRSSDQKRDLEGVPEYNKEDLIHLVSVLTHVTDAFTSAKGAVDILTSIPMDTISPDGKLGGRGFVMPVRDIKEDLNNMQVILSNIKDTLTDEFNNPNWGLSQEEKEGILSVKTQVEQNSKENLDGVDQQLQQMFSDEGTGEAEGTGEDVEIPTDDESADDSFPDMPEDTGTTEGESTVKTASEKTVVFVGMRKQASPLAQKLASRVLAEITKRASEGKKLSASVGDK
jgi:hypothetical protein